MAKNTGPKKTKAKEMTIRWFGEPRKHDYGAAELFLSLIMQPNVADGVVEQLQRAAMAQFAAKDIFRASGLPLLGFGNSHIEKDRAAIIRGEKLSPILLMRDERAGKLVIADGYHRLCAVYTFDEDAIIPCKIV
jgi:hypothetical protein